MQRHRLIRRLFLTTLGTPLIRSRFTERSRQQNPILGPALSVRRGEQLAPLPPRLAAGATRLVLFGRPSVPGNSSRPIRPGVMEALRAWRASNLLGFAASRAVTAASAARPLRLRCCSAAAPTTNQKQPPLPQDRRRRSASTSTSDRDSIRAIRLKKVRFALLCVFSSALFGASVLLPPILGRCCY